MGYQTFAKEASPLSRGRFAALRASLSRQRRLIRRSLRRRSKLRILRFRPAGGSSLTSLLLLFPPDPLRWVPVGALRCFSRRTEGELPQRGKRGRPGACRREKRLRSFRACGRETLRGLGLALVRQRPTRAVKKPYDVTTENYCSTVWTATNSHAPVSGLASLM